jgi:hypothetical protein
MQIYQGTDLSGSHSLQYRKGINNHYLRMGALAPCRWQHTESQFSLSYACVTFSQEWCDVALPWRWHRYNAALRRDDVTSGVEACADPFWQPAFAVLTPFIKMSYRPHCRKTTHFGSEPCYTYLCEWMPSHKMAVGLKVTINACCAPILPLQYSGNIRMYCTAE